MIPRFKKHIENEFPFLNGKKLLVACSGGVDSVVLSHLLFTLSFDIGLAHCNFSLRGKESDGDEMFVVGLAKMMEIPVFVETFDTKKYAKDRGISTQMAARTLRYEWFDSLLNNFKYDHLITAHHLDDDLETFFINLSRGTGINGLIGIPPINEKIIRPLLDFSRSEIEEYALRHDLKWREDSTNKENDYLRNKLRNQIIPLYKETSANLLSNFQKTQKNLRASKALVEDYMTLIYNLAVREEKGCYKIDIAKLKEIPNTDALLFELLNGFGFTEWNDVVSLLDAQTGKQLFSSTHRLLKNRGELLLSVLEDDHIDDVFTVSIHGISYPIKLDIEEVPKIDEIDQHTIYVDADKITFPLQIRRWQEGDSFMPFGMIGKKKVSKFFKDEKIPLSQKKKIWLLCSGDEIVWVIGYRADNRYRITDTTETILRIARRKV